MKYLLFTFIVQLLFTSHIMAQDPVLVTDYNDGPESSFDEFNLGSLELDQNFIFKLISKNQGEELGILSNGQISILKDINVGEGNSSPKEFVKFKGKIFFSAFDGTDRGLWSTDGTEEGTSVVFVSPLNTELPKALQVSGSDKLFFVIKNTLLVYNGNKVDTVQSGINLYEDFNSTSKSYCTYKDGIAFLKDSNYSTELIYSDGEEIFESLGKIEGLSFSHSSYGIQSVFNDLIFSISDNKEEFNGNYHFEDSTNELKKYLINENIDVRISDLMKFEDGRCLGLVLKNGYYIFSDEPLESELIFEHTPSYTVTGERISYATLNDKLLFMASGKGFGDKDKIVLTDGTSVGTSILFEPYNDDITNMKMVNKYVFFATSVKIGYNPEFYYVNILNGDFEKLSQSSLEWNSFESAHILGVQNNLLFYMGNYNADIGYELYSLDIGDIISNVTDNTIQSINVSPNPSNGLFRINGIMNGRYNIYSPIGSKLSSGVLKEELINLQGLSKGIYIIEIISGKNKFIDKIIIE